MKNKNPNPNPDLHYIEGKYSQSYNGVSFVIRNGDKEKEFTPKKYLRLILDQCYEAVDNSENNIDKLNALFNGETIIKRIIDDCGLNYNDFEGLFKDIEVISKRLANYKEQDDKKSAVRTTALIAITAAVLGGAVPEFIKLFQKSQQPTYIIVPNNTSKSCVHRETCLVRSNQADTLLVKLKK